MVSKNLEGLMVKKLGLFAGISQEVGLFAGIVLELFYQDCLGLFAPLV